VPRRLRTPRRFGGLPAAFKRAIGRLYKERIIVIEKNGTDSLVAIKNITMNEEFFQGHFPGKPVMPGVLQIEALAQAVGLLMLEPGKIPLFMSIDKCKFRRAVVPGDQLRLEVEKIKVKTK